MSLGPCTTCNVAAARVTLEGWDLCARCAEVAYQRVLAAPDADAGSVSFVAMSAARMIATYDRRDHVITIGLPGISVETLAGLSLSLAFHGLTLVRDDGEGSADIFDQEAINRAAGLYVERMHVGAMLEGGRS